MFIRKDKLNGIKEELSFKDLLYSMGFNFVLPSEYGGFNSLRRCNLPILEKCEMLRNDKIHLLESEHAYWGKYPKK